MYESDTQKILEITDGQDITEIKLAQVLEQISDELMATGKKGKKSIYPLFDKRRIP